MTTKPLTLTEISRLMDELPAEEAMNNEQIRQFIDIVETSGKELLRHRGKGEYALDAAQFLCAAAATEFLSQSDFESFLEIMKNNGLFTKFAGIVFIYSVGLSITEELR